MSAPNANELYAEAIRGFGPALDRLAAGYEADPAKRHDLRQEIHLQLWKSLAAFDGRCSLKTWSFRVAHNTSISYAHRERRNNSPLISLEDLDRSPAAAGWEPDIDQHRSLQRLHQLVWTLKPLDRQILLSYLEEMDNAAIAEITGLTPANVAMKVHRIKRILARRMQTEELNA
ncbi:MAG TPA: sigma-70 family RNA polymerase sigma factor [Bryobacteraceae bacterium]|nr:sigma-70 family RNA polymerase sigma factor [Bryobacteraceae bacterium]